MAARIIVGLVGFRCCGKSTLRGMLSELGYPVFDTNSIRTGDSDANRISLDEVLHRYGGSESYLHFIEGALRDFVAHHEGIIFIDSLKVSADASVLMEMFPDASLQLWYLHASNDARLARYANRDLVTNLRSEALETHDAALERHGILSLIKSANEVIDMQDDLSAVRLKVERSLERLRKKTLDLHV